MELFSIGNFFLANKMLRVTIVLNEAMFVSCEAFLKITQILNSIAESCSGRTDIPSRSLEFTMQRICLTRYQQHQLPKLEH